MMRVTCAASVRRKWRKFRTLTDTERMALPEIWAALEAIQRGRTLVELPVGQGGTFRLPAGAPLKITASFYRLSDSELVVTGLKVRMTPLA